MRLISVLCLAASMALLCACGANQTPAATAAATPALEQAPIDEATYRAVLASVFDGYRDDVQALESLDPRFTQADGLADYRRPALGARMVAALRDHRISASQMADFARDNPDVVREVNGDNASRMRAIQSELRQVVARIRARNAERVVASASP